MLILLLRWFDIVWRDGLSCFACVALDGQSWLDTPAASWVVLSIALWCTLRFIIELDPSLSTLSRKSVNMLSHHAVDVNYNRTLLLHAPAPYYNHETTHIMHSYITPAIEPTNLHKSRSHKYPFMDETPPSRWTTVERV